MGNLQHQQAAQALLDAFADRVPVAPLSERFPGFDVDDAYAVQQQLLRHWTDNGGVVAGHKIGLTSAAIQQQLGVFEPDFGVLMADAGHLSGAEVDLSPLIAPRAEPELALVLGEDLRGPGVGPAQALAAVERVSAALEVIDSRIADWRIALVDTVADNASSGAWVVDPGGVAPADIDLAAVPCTLSRAGDVVETGSSSAVLGSPVRALVWLANTLGERGAVLRAGHVVLSGAITASVPLRAGDTVSADLGGVGTVSARFT